MLSMSCQLEAERISMRIVAAQSLWESVFNGASYNNSIKSKSFLQAVFNVTPIHPIFDSSGRSSKGWAVIMTDSPPPTNVTNTTTYLCAREIVWVCLYSCYNLTQNYAIGEHIRLRERKINRHMVQLWIPSILICTEFLLVPSGYHETPQPYNIENCIRANIFHVKKPMLTESILVAQMAMINLKFFQEKKKKNHQTTLNSAMQKFKK